MTTDCYNEEEKFILRRWLRDPKDKDYISKMVESGRLTYRLPIMQNIEESLQNHLQHCLDWLQEACEELEMKAERLRIVPVESDEFIYAFNAAKRAEVKVWRSTNDLLSSFYFWMLDHREIPDEQVIPIFLNLVKLKGDKVFDGPPIFETIFAERLICFAHSNPALLEPLQKYIV